LCNVRIVGVVFVHAANVFKKEVGIKTFAAEFA